MSSQHATTVYLHALTPIHSGVGQTPAVVDLPIAREKATNWPMLPGSSIKGVLHDLYRNQDWAKSVFGVGPEGDSQGMAGAVSFTDMRILCLPVRSFYGTFAWVTCPLALRRFLRDSKALGASAAFDGPVPDVTDMNVLTGGGALIKDGKVYLEDLDLSAQESADAKNIATALAQSVVSDQAQDFVARFAIASDEVFDFLSETGTEITARIALEEQRKTVPKGGLWYEEAVPAEALFVGWLVKNGRGEPEALLQTLANGAYLQIGGNSTVGRGLCRLVVQR